MAEIQPKSKEPSDKWDESVDVVIIGSGFAGLAAAIEARSRGAGVLVLEKMHAAGGNSFISDGGVAAPGTQLQAKFGIKDSAEGMYADMMRAGLGLGDPALVKMLAEQAADAFEWSRKDLGVEYYDRVDIFGGHSVPRCYTPLHVSGSTIIKCMLRKAGETGVQLRCGTYFQNFIQDPQGRVCGVAVRENWDYRNKYSGTVKKIEAKKAVILAAGGFGADVAFRSAQDPRLTEAIDTTNKPFANSEALIEAMNIGAAAVDLSQIQLGPWASPDEKGYGDGPQFSEYIVFQYGIIVDPRTGCRFANELSDRKSLSDKILRVGHPCIGIADEHAVKQSGWNIDRCLRKNVVRKFESLTSLASFYQIPLPALDKTMNDFNEAFINGEDVYFGKPFIENAVPITHPPFYAIRLWPKVHYTMGGIKINSDSEVIGSDGGIIRGLFAAGEVTGGIHGASRLGSCSITDCLVFGRIAGKNVALLKAQNTTHST
ncbi:MAG: flavocytochrome c [Eubacteriales bacterium]